MENFRKEVMKRLKKRLGDEYQLFPIDSLKNNKLLVHGICIQKNNEDVSVIVYVDEYIFYYAARMMTLEEIADKLIQQCHKEAIPPMLLNEIENFQKIRDKVRIRLINYAANSADLVNYPHRKYLDLAVTYYLDLDLEIMGENAAIVVTNNHLERWNVSEEDLYKIGMKSLYTIGYCTVTDLPNLVRKLAREEKDEKVRAVFRNMEKEGIPKIEMYVASNSKNLYGAACMLNIPLLQELAESRGCDLMIYPSNVNRLVIVPVEGGNKDRLSTEDVHRVNMSSVPRISCLSNSIYLYDKTKQEVSIYKEGAPL